jgi:hypothetical protein
MLPTRNILSGSKSHGWETFPRGASRRSNNYNFPSITLAFTVGFLACLVAMSIVQFTLIPNKHAEYAAVTPSSTPQHIFPNNQQAVTHNYNTAPSPLLSNNRKKVLAVVGVQTGFTSPKDINSRKYDYTARRKALRKTWFPPSQQALDDLESRLGIVVRFVIGHASPTANKNPDALESQIKSEEAQYGDFLRLPLEENYNTLTNKTLAFFTHVVQQYDAEYILKIDDDVYFRPDRLSHAIKQWKDVDAGYVGCMKTGEILKSPKFRWWEPQWELLGGSRYFAHSWGSAYALSGAAASFLASMPRNSLRFLANEDTTIGLWMLAFNIKHLDDRRLCEARCTASSLVTYDIPACSGLCYAAEELVMLHNSTECHSPTVPRPGADFPLAPSMFYFDGKPDVLWEKEKMAQYVESQRKAAEMEKKKAELKAAGDLIDDSFKHGNGNSTVVGKTVRNSSNSSTNNGSLENLFGQIAAGAHDNVN